MIWFLVFSFCLVWGFGFNLFCCLGFGVGFSGFGCFMVVGDLVGVGGSGFGFDGFGGDVVVFWCFGGCYVDLLLLGVWSVRCFSPGVGVVVLCDRFVGGLVGVGGVLVLVVDLVGLGFSGLDRVLLLGLRFWLVGCLLGVFSGCLFLDCDCVVVGDLDRVFGLLGVVGDRVGFWGDGGGLLGGEFWVGGLVDRLGGVGLVPVGLGGGSLCCGVFLVGVGGRGLLFGVWGFLCGLGVGGGGWGGVCWDQHGVLGFLCCVGGLVGLGSGDNSLVVVGGGCWGGEVVVHFCGGVVEGGKLGLVVGFLGERVLLLGS